MDEHDAMYSFIYMCTLCVPGRRAVSQTVRNASKNVNRLISVQGNTVSGCGCASPAGEWALRGNCLLIRGKHVNVEAPRGVGNAELQEPVLSRIVVRDDNRLRACDDLGKVFFV